MIVKNEESGLEETLASIYGIFDEIIIVDTGSSDNTVSIAKKYTDKVFDYTWCDDFSSARNYSISKANNDWILVLDGDETITYADKNNLDNLDMDSNLVGRVRRRNPFDDGGDIKVYIERVNRFFNKNLYEYKGKIHEQIVRKDNKEYSTVDLDITLNHIGYMSEVIKSSKKLERNIEMLLTELNNSSNDPYINYQLGKSYYKLKNYDRSFYYFEKALSYSEDYKLEYVLDLVISYGYSLLKCEKYQKALSLEKYADRYGEVTDYQFLMGLIHMNNGMFNESINDFNTCTKMNEGGIEGINSYYSYYNMGVIYETTGNFRFAAINYGKSIDYDKSRARLEIVMKSLVDKLDEEKNFILENINSGSLQEAEFYTELILAHFMSDEIMSINGLIKLYLNKYDEAIEIFKIMNDFDSIYNLAFAEFKYGEYVSSIKRLEELLLRVNDNDFRNEIIELRNEVHKAMQKKEGNYGDITLHDS